MRHFKFVPIILMVVCFIVPNISFSGDLRSISLVGGEYPPFSGSALPDGGLNGKIAAEAFKKVGYTVTISHRPWARLMAEGKAGKFDAIIGLWFREDRKEWFEYSDPLGANEIVFFKHKDSDIRFTKYEDLSQYRVGAVRGYANPPGFESGGFIIEEVSVDYQNVKKLQKKRIDLAIFDKVLGLYLIHTKFPEYKDELEWIMPVLKKDLQHMGFSKKAANYQEKLKAFNKGLNMIKEDGTYKKIREQYGLSD